MLVYFSLVLRSGCFSAGESASSPAPVEPDCYSYDSDEEDFAPVQQVGSSFPTAAHQLSWTLPSTYTSYVSFSGAPGHSAHHEGHDLIHTDTSTPDVEVYAASAGEIVYVRTGCPQSDLFTPNTDLRECGSGWGNHIVIDHDGVLTRYAHLAPNSILVSVGDLVQLNDELALMGNSGRSETRHLHFELGTHSLSFDPCLASQSFDAVYSPSELTSLQP